MAGDVGDRGDAATAVAIVAIVAIVATVATVAMATGRRGPFDLLFEVSGLDQIVHHCFDVVAVALWREKSRVVSLLWITSIKGGVTSITSITSGTSSTPSTQAPQAHQALKHLKHLKHTKQHFVTLSSTNTEDVFTWP